MMGSEIKLVSTFGVGSRFWFDLRLAKASVLQQTLVTDEIDLHGYRLLVVEDNEINMEIVCELLRNVGGPNLLQRAMVKRRSIYFARQSRLLMTQF